MFDADERTTLLMLLWNWKMEVEAAIDRGDVPADQVGPARDRLERELNIVRKLGGDPAKPAFGA